MRVSTTDQDTALQLDALTGIGCSKIFEDRASGAQVDRAGLREALAYVREGDVPVTWKLDRLGRSLPHLIETVAALDGRGVDAAPSPKRLTPPRPAAGWCSTCSALSGSSSVT